MVSPSRSCSIDFFSLLAMSKYLSLLSLSVICRDSKFHYSVGSLVYFMSTITKFGWDFFYNNNNKSASFCTRSNRWFFLGVWVAVCFLGSTGPPVSVPSRLTTIDITITLVCYRFFLVLWQGRSICLSFHFLVFSLCGSRTTKSAKWQALFFR